MFSSHFEEEAVVLAATRWPLLSGYLLFAIEITTLASETKFVFLSSPDMKRRSL